MARFKRFFFALLCCTLLWEIFRQMYDLVSFTIVHWLGGFVWCWIYDAFTKKSLATIRYWFVGSVYTYFLFPIRYWLSACHPSTTTTTRDREREILDGIMLVNFPSFADHKIYFHNKFVKKVPNLWDLCQTDPMNSGSFQAEARSLRQHRFNDVFQCGRPVKSGKLGMATVPETFSRESNVVTLLWRDPNAF